MDRHLPVISRSSLFDGIDHNDLEALLHCLCLLYTSSHAGRIALLAFSSEI